MATRLTGEGSFDGGFDGGFDGSFDSIDQGDRKQAKQPDVRTVAEKPRDSTAEATIVKYIAGSTAEAMVIGETIKLTNRPATKIKVTTILRETPENSS